MTTWRLLVRAVTGAVTVAVLAAAVTSCAGEQDAPRATSRTVLGTLPPAPGGAASPSSEPSPADPPGSSTSPAPGRAGASATDEASKVVSGSGVSFEVPAVYAPVSPALLGVLTQGDAVAEALQGTGTDPADLDTLLDSALALNDATGALLGRPRGVVAFVLPGLVDLPAPPALRQLLETNGQTIERLGQRRTAAGPASTATYQVAFGGQSLAGTVVLVDLGTTVVDITVTTSTRDETDARAAQVLSTLRRG